LNDATASDALAATRRWVESFVVGLNLCPFARRVLDSGRIRFVVSAATNEPGLLDDLGEELDLLIATPRAEVETTLVIHPHVLSDFLDYNDFVARAEGLLRKRKLTGVVQIASFHPHYQFAGTQPDAVENYTNRSPYPMLHLLREDSVTEVSGDESFVAAIPGRNVETLKRLGRAEIEKRLRAIGIS
jgi:uncharacterized protein